MRLFTIMACSLMLFGGAVAAQDLTMELLPGTTMPTESFMQTNGGVLLHTYSADKFPQVPGPETTVKIYRFRDQQIATYSFANLNIYAVATKRGQLPVEGCVDEDSLGYCTRLVQEDEEFSVNFKAYGVKTANFEHYETDVLDLPQAQGLDIPQKPSDFSGAQKGEKP